MSTTDSNLKETVSPSELTPAESSHEVPADTPTEPTPKKSRSLLIAVVVLIIAVAVTVAILVRNQHLSQDLSQLQTSLSESQNKWKETAAKKEALQTELADVENNIREAQLTYDESTVKIADLTGQIETLTAQVRLLHHRLDVLNTARDCAEGGKRVHRGSLAGHDRLPQSDSLQSQDPKKDHGRCPEERKEPAGDALCGRKHREGGQRACRDPGSGKGTG